MSDGEDLSTAHLVRELACLMNKTPRLLAVPASLLQLSAACIRKTAEVERLVGSLQVDSSAIRTELAWQPPFTVREGLEETVRWFKNETAI